ncbi:MAG: hydrogenase formation protein HypD [Anaerolineales bacterium]|nr:hydrogenase formation protein HypD [Anaerolineales bacterium]
MKYIDEYRDEATAQWYVEAIRRTVTRPWTLMEICGGQTHTMLKFGLDRMLPEEVTLVHGPGCPVCVTPVELLDKAIAIASRTGVTFCSFGDMLRVPGSHKDLLMTRAEGADVRMVYSPLDALKLAQRNPEREVVFFAVGFETTAPANAMAVWQAKQMGLRNFSILSAHVLVPPAIETILSAPGNEVQGFLAPGHVCTVMGYWEYEPIAERYRAPIVVTGFEPLDILRGLYITLRALEEGRWGVENQYARSVRREGNVQAQRLIWQVFEVTDRAWRGIGVIPQSGLRLREEYAGFDAERRFDVAEMAVEESPECIAGLILQGRKKPPECSAFGARCTPDHPLGAPMVSSEGACAAYYRYGQRATG